MDPRVAKLKTPQECESFAKNARERNAFHLAEEARQRSVQIRAESHGVGTEVERECLQAIYAYEEILSAQRGRRIRASRTWQMINKHGILPAIESIVMKRADRQGFIALSELNLTEFAFEAVILRHHYGFSPEVVIRARERMENNLDKELSIQYSEFAQLHQFFT